MSNIHAYAAQEKGGPFETYEYDPGELQSLDVEIEVESCGICHSDLSMLDNEWQLTQYPFVGGHEVIGRIAAMGEHVPHLEVGDRVGLGWTSRSCMHCDQCMSGDHNLCPTAEGTITHQHGGFADRVRCHWGWATKVPDGVDAVSAGPLLCGGLTVFNPLLQYNLSPTSKVGIVGIGGLGHMAIQFCDAWGCEVTAISRSRSKEDEARQLGADHFLATGEDGALESVKGHFDLILNTTDAELPWDAYIAALAPHGKLHTVGAAPKIEATVFPMIMGQKSLSSSPTGSIAATRTMFDFVARHDIRPMTEVYPMSEINEAFDKLRNGSPRYRLVLTRDN
ncbi:NADPH-dependent aldehyde reductase Ahr [Rhodopirellula sallentina]|uniref:alcohol dehydrogenase (NADP(+)) n=1 Tax=Rhodopirellula sallentina SM41 TaxID=1263870 RepID=M5TUN7_9BACT|nr:NAD(P)-dependent alcohol dehydrogenase [Rhodopirellula sallentina]EMI52907.1 zinc-type alcohol dehydrogenase-like protein YjgB [Rhodopirellula sallentina SM41]